MRTEKQIVDNVNAETVSAILAAAGINNEIVQDGQAIWLESIEVDDDRVIKVDRRIGLPYLQGIAREMLD
jgi:hypothetical protein